MPPGHSSFSFIIFIHDGGGAYKYLFAKNLSAPFDTPKGKPRSLHGAAYA